jgi:small subunit ribosomal protein S20
MPNSPSAKKRLRQNFKRRTHNRSVKSAVRTQIKKLRSAIDAGELDKAQEQLRLAQKKLDQASSANVIHPNQAARFKSRLTSALKTAQAEAAK